MMKTIKTSLIVLTISIVSHSSYSEGFRVNLNHLVFHIPDDTISYIEIQFLFLGDGMVYKLNPVKLYQAKASVKIQFANEKTNQVIGRQYNFLSEEYKDTISEEKNSMYNLVRIPLPLGTYRMKITAFDANDSLAPPLTYQEVVTIDFDREKVWISDIQAVSVLEPTDEQSVFTKYGYDYMPYFSTFYPENIAKLTYFAGIYNLDKEEKEFYAYSYIAQEGPYMPFSADFLKEKKLQNTNNYALIQQFDIDSLPSGNYNLVLDVKDKQDSLYNRATLFFQRSNPSVAQPNTTPITNLSFDTMKLYLNYIYPIATTVERDFINRVTPSDYKAIEDFFQKFWYVRDKNNPQEAWFKYYKMVMQVNKNYTTLRFKGYKTDRGYYYLKYGPPNYIEQYPSDINSYSYEIWSYYSFPATGQTHVYFVFYEKDLVSKDFRLLHTNANGELQNSRWKQILGLKDTDFPMPDDNSLKKDIENFNTDDNVY